MASKSMHEDGCPLYVSSPVNAETPGTVGWDKENCVMLFELEGCSEQPMSS